MKLLLALILSHNLLADDVVLITADRIKSDINRSANNVELISEEMLTKTYTPTLSELLKTNSDIQIANGSIFLRGTDSSHTLIVLDGVVLNDPSNPNRSFDIGKFSMNNIKSIEILKGAQGLLYGANAVGGVIVITSKTHATRQLTGSAFASYGTYQTFNAGVDAQKQFGIHKFSFGAEHFKTNGFSAANIKLNPNAESDGEKRSNLNIHSVSEFSSHSSLEANIRYTHDLLDLDNCGGSGCDDSTNHLTNEDLFSKIQFNKIWESELLETHFFYTRGIFSHFNKSSLFSSQNKGEINTFGVNHTNYLNEYFTQNIYLDFAKETNQLNQYNENSSIFFYHKYDLGNFIYNFGLRLDHNKIFNDHLTYKFATATKLTPEHLLRISYSTGFTAPGLFQFLDPIYGNINLKPEKSSSLEFGHEWNRNLNQLHTSFFITTIYDRFTYVESLKKTINSGSSYINGIEESLKTSFSQTSITLLKSWLPRRPHILVKNTFNYQELSLETEYVGNRPDVDQANATVIAPAYCISHLNYSYQNWFLKIKNIFNTEYEEAYGYGTGGRMITFGFKANL